MTPCVSPAVRHIRNPSNLVRTALEDITLRLLYFLVTEEFEDSLSSSTLTSAVFLTLRPTDPDSSIH
jgi:hypothetical protein